MFGHVLQTNIDIFVRHNAKLEDGLAVTVPPLARWQEVAMGLGARFNGLGPVGENILPNMGTIRSRARTLHTREPNGVA